MPVFELTETAPSQASPEDILGMWETTAGNPAGGGGTGGAKHSGAVSFGVLSGGSAPQAANPDPDPEITVWRVRLPADLSRATARLEQAQTQIETSQRALPRAQQRVAEFAERAEERATLRGGAVSFAAGAAPSSAAPALRSLRAEADPVEAALIDALVGIEHEQQGAEAGVSFGVLGGIDEGWESIREHVQAFVRRMLEALTTYVRVETEVGGVVLARTTVGWGGGVRTIARQDTPPSHLALHHETLTLALRSQDTLLRTIVVAAQGAIKLAVVLSTPGGVVLALPSAWKFINTLLLQEQGSAAG